MTFVRLWRYKVAEVQRPAFERAYGPEGDWARLFGRAEGYLGTELLAASGGKYLTVDRWRDRRDWDAFLADLGDDYRALDRRLENLDVEEEDLGDWISV